MKILFAMTYILEAPNNKSSVTGRALARRITANVAKLPEC